MEPDAVVASAKAAKEPRKEYLDPMHSIGYLARVNFRLFSRALEDRIQQFGISSGQWRFLRVLWEEDGLTQRELSERVGTKEATTVHAVRGLVRAGLARRVQSGDDKRKYHVQLTQKAKKLRAPLMEVVVKVNETALAGLSDEDIATTRRVLAHTIANLRACPEVSDD